MKFAWSQGKNQLPVKIAIYIAFLNGAAIATSKRAEKKELRRRKCLVLFMSDITK